MTNDYPPRPRSTTPCPDCGGTLVLRRDKTAHRQRMCCECCAYSAPLPLSLRLRMQGWAELPLFEQEEANR